MNEANLTFNFSVLCDYHHIITVTSQSILWFGREFGLLGTPANRIQRPMDRSHWRATDHVFGQVTSVEMSATKSDHDYNYKTYFKIWRENQEFERQNFPTSRPTL